MSYQVYHYFEPSDFSFQFKLHAFENGIRIKQNCHHLGFHSANGHRKSKGKTKWVLSGALPSLCWPEAFKEANVHIWSPISPVTGLGFPKVRSAFKEAQQSRVQPLVVARRSHVNAAIKTFWQVNSRNEQWGGHCIGIKAFKKYQIIFIIVIHFSSEWKLHRQLHLRIPKCVSN